MAVGERYKWKVNFEHHEMSTTAASLEEAVATCMAYQEELELGKPISVELFTPDIDVNQGSWGTVYVF